MFLKEYFCNLSNPFQMHIFACVHPPTFCKPKISGVTEPKFKKFLQGVESANVQMCRSANLSIFYPVNCSKMFFERIFLQCASKHNSNRTSVSISDSLMQLLPNCASRRALHELCFLGGQYRDNGKPTALAYHGRVSSTYVLPSIHHW